MVIVTILRWVLGGVLLYISVSICVGNAIYFWKRYLLKREAPSVIPYVSGISGVIGLLVIPLAAVHQWCWLPLVLDLGSLPRTVFGLIYYAIFRRYPDSTERSTMVVSVFNSSQQFTFEYLYREDISRVIKFAYDVSERVNQTVYVLAFEIDGQIVGERPFDGPPESATVHLGREDAANVRWFGVGSDIVLWKPDSEDWACELITAHWKEGQICWGVFVDERDTADIVSSIQAAWPRQYARGDISRLLESSIGPQRKLALLSYDGNCFFGKTTADCWDLVLSQLREISEGELEEYNIPLYDIIAAVDFVTSPGMELRNGWWCFLEFQSKRYECALMLEKLPPIGLDRHTGISIKFLCDKADEPHLQVGDQFTLWERKWLGRKKLGEGTVEQILPE